MKISSRLPNAERAPASIGLEFLFEEYREGDGYRREYCGSVSIWSSGPYVGDAEVNASGVGIAICKLAGVPEVHATGYHQNDDTAIAAVITRARAEQERRQKAVDEFEAKAKADAAAKAAAIWRKAAEDIHELIKRSLR